MLCMPHLILVNNQLGPRLRLGPHCPRGSASRVNVAASFHTNSVETLLVHTRSPRYAGNMKRRVTKTRLVLAALLLAVAGLSFAYWPRTPRARIPAGEVVGFDMARGVVITKDALAARADSVSLTAWDLRTGESRDHVVLRAPTGADSGSAAVVLSPDGKQAAVWRDRSPVIEVVAYPSKKRVVWMMLETHNRKVDHGVAGEPYLFEDHFLGGRGGPPRSFSVNILDWIDQVGFSEDGQTLIAISLGRIHAWNLRTDAVISERNSSPLLLGLEHLKVRSDGRFLIEQNILHGMRLWEVASGRLVHTLPSVSEAGFLPDGQPIVAVEFDGDHGKHISIHLDKDEMATLSEAPWPAGELPVLVERGMIVTAEARHTRFEWPTWVPQTVIDVLEQCLGWNRYLLRLRDPITLQEHCAFVVELDPQAIRQAAGFKAFSPNSRATQLGGLLRRLVAVSPDGQFVIVRGNDYLNIWDVPPPREPASWLTTGAIALLALWVAWPRKLKSTPQPV
jgi:hypothetical protein